RKRDLYVTAAGGGAEPPEVVEADDHVARAGLGGHRGLDAAGLDVARGRSDGQLVGPDGAQLNVARGRVDAHGAAHQIARLDVARGGVHRDLAFEVAEADVAGGHVDGGAHRRRHADG